MLFIHIKAKKLALKVIHKLVAYLNKLMEDPGSTEAEKQDRGAYREGASRQGGSGVFLEKVPLKLTLKDGGAEYNIQRDLMISWLRQLPCPTQNQAKKFRGQRAPHPPGLCTSAQLRPCFPNGYTKLHPRSNESEFQEWGLVVSFWERLYDG